MSMPMGFSGHALPYRTMDRVNDPSTMAIWAKAGLELTPTICQALGMQKGRNTAAGGIFIFLGLVVGIALGVHNHQLSAYMLGGFAAGVLGAMLYWLYERKRP